MRLLMIDNYDSFTYNLVQYLGELGAEVDVVRNDVASVADLLERRPDGVVVSPGPGVPENAGVSVGVVEDNFGALMSATREAAALNQLDDTIGTLEVGKEADVIVVDGDPIEDLGALEHVRMTFVRGCLLFSR